MPANPDGSGWIFHDYVSANINSTLNLRTMSTSPLRKLIRNNRSAASGSRMEDVAALASVSLITVSRVINTPDKVASATRERTACADGDTRHIVSVHRVNPA